MTAPAEPHEADCDCGVCEPTPVLVVRLPGGSLATSLEGDELWPMMARLAELLPPVEEAKVVLVPERPVDALRALKE